MNEKLEIKEDARGKLAEIFKVPGFGQVFYSVTKPGITRGNHFHIRKTEKFCVIEGRAKICLRNRATGEIREIAVSGDNLEIVKITTNWTHNIKNIGDVEMKLVVWVNEIFNPDAPDTFSEEV